MDKIAFAVLKYLGLSETFIYEPIRKMSFFEVIVLTEEKKNLDLFPHPYIYSLSDLPPWSRFWEKISCQLGRFRYFKKIMERHKPKLIHAHFGWEGIFMLPLKKDLNLPLITSFYGRDVSLYPRSPFVRWQLKQLFTKGDLFLSCSQKMKKDLVLLGCPQDKIIVHYLGVDTKNFNFKPRMINRDHEIIVLMCGRLIEKKGTLYGIKAVANLLPRYRNLKLKIIGDGPLKGKIKKFIQRNGLSSRIFLLGSKSYSEVIREMQNAHVFMAPSITARSGEQEGLPMVLIEALASGLPTISTFHAGIPELIQSGVNGLLTEEKNITGLSEHLVKLIENPALLLKFAEAGRRRVEEDFNLEKQVKKLENIYKGLIYG